MRFVCVENTHTHTPQPLTHIYAEDLVMPGRVSVLLRGIGNSFGIELRMAKIWEKYARKVLEDAGVEYVPKKTIAMEGM